MRTIKEIYLAGGCFWGVEAYIKNIPGVIETEVGYANGTTENPTYEDVCGGSGHAEVCRAIYDSSITALSNLLERFFDIIDPIAVNRQGNDVGAQYRTGIYFKDKDDSDDILNALANLQKSYDKPLAVEALPLENYTAAEEYHQDYLKKNPGGYCHIPKEKLM